MKKLSTIQATQFIATLRSKPLTQHQRLGQAIMNELPLDIYQEVTGTPLDIFFEVDDNVSEAKFWEYFVEV